MCKKRRIGHPWFPFRHRLGVQVQWIAHFIRMLGWNLHHSSCPGFSPPFSPRLVIERVNRFLAYTWSSPRIPMCCTHVALPSRSIGSSHLAFHTPLLPRLSSVSYASRPRFSSPTFLPSPKENQLRCASPLSPLFLPTRREETPFSWVFPHSLGVGEERRNSRVGW